MTATALPGIAPAPSTDAASPRGRAALRTLWNDSLVYAGRNAAHMCQVPEKLLDVTLQPIMFVLLFAFVLGGAIAVDGSNYRVYLIGGILVQSLAFGTMGPGTSIASDLLEGVIDRFRSLPAPSVPTSSATTCASSAVSPCPSPSC